MIKPSFKITTSKEEKDYGKFVLEPLEQGYGHTVGNALRRCLLTSLQGAAVRKIKINGVHHRFSTIEGLKEDVVELILNLKQLKVAYKGKDEVKLILKASGPKEVKAKDIKTPPEVKIINKDLHIAKLADKKSKLEAEIYVQSSLGYSPAEEVKSSTLGIIPLDATFSPVRRVNYKVEATRVGRRTDLDKLILQIWTNGTIKPRETLEEAAKILVAFFKQIVEPVFEEKPKKEVKKEDSEVLKLTVEELSLPTRIANALRRGGYGIVADLTKAKIEDIAKVKNLGARSIEVIIEALKKKGVSLASS